MHPGKTLLVAALLLAPFMLDPIDLPAANETSRDTLVQVVTPQGTMIVAEVADTTEKRARGLMFLESLPRDRGMLFTFADAQAWTFWMKNTLIPLDIIWMDRDKRIVHVEKNVPGCTRQDDGCPQYQPNEDALYVLELAAGQAEALGLHRGTRLQFDLSRSARPEPSPGPSRRGTGQSPGHR
jgi:uncharacterized membrane protein (UPF0127 family)